MERFEEEEPPAETQDVSDAEEEEDEEDVEVPEDPEAWDRERQAAEEKIADFYEANHTSLTSGTNSTKIRKSSGQSC